jgi:hypothetical protein
MSNQKAKQVHEIEEELTTLEKEVLAVSYKYGCRLLDKPINNNDMLDFINIAINARKLNNFVNTVIRFDAGFYFDGIAVHLVSESNKDEFTDKQLKVR